jgi:glycosyltransferase involved in cell wall biosynthesis
MKLSIIVPVFNEKYWLGSFWNDLKSAPIERCHGVKDVELIVVDDGSTDGTRRILRDLSSVPFQFLCGIEARVILLENDKNMGKGYSLRRAVKESSGDLVLFQDSDLEYSPSDYPKLIFPFFNNSADVVIGNRFSGEPVRVLYFWHYFANKILNLISNVLNNLTLKDFVAGYKVFRGELIRALNMSSNRFGIEAELVSRVAKARLRIFEVSVQYNGRTYEEGKKLSLVDGFLLFFQILKFGLFSREPFKPGLFQTLTALDKVSRVIYIPLLQKSLSCISIQKQDLKILEVGAGIGSLTRELVKYGSVSATDISETYVHELEERFKHYHGFEAFKWDASDPQFPLGTVKYDVIVSFNVLEHIEQDQATLNIWRNLLKPGGSLIVLVPNSPSLFSPVDKAIGHFRRYSRNDLCHKIDRAGLGVRDVSFGNFFGIFGWIINGLILKKSEISSGSLRLYAVLKPFLRPFESLLERYFGLNLIVVASDKKK